MTINLTDPANHPANEPLIVERITRIIAELRRSLEYQNGGDMAISDDMNLHQKSFAQGRNACRAAIILDNHRDLTQPVDS